MDEQGTDDYGGSWYAATGIEAPTRPPLTVDTDVDVCVIGAGLAGLTTALEVARLGWSVAVLEARRVAWNASSRNCGFVLPGYAADDAALVERVGTAKAKRLWALSAAGAAYVRAMIREHELPAVEPRRGWLDVVKTDDTAGIIDTVALLRDELGAAVEIWPAEQVRAVLRSDAYFSAMHFPDAFTIHPLNYALGLARLAEEAGARIYEGTPATEIDPAGVRKRIATPSAMVRAAHVVLAGNVQIGGLMPELASTLLPITSVTAVTARLGDGLKEAIAWEGGVSDSRYANYHYRVVDGDRLLWCGEGSCFPSRDPRKVAEGFRDAIAETYPQLGRPEIEYAWDGTMGFALHRMPQIGEVTPGLWLASAFAGHGLNTTALAGNLIAHAIVEGDDSWTAFEPWDLVWAGGRLGRLGHELWATVRNRREKMAGSLARRRERRRLTGAMKALTAAAGEAAEPTPSWSAARAAAAGPVEPGFDAEPPLPAPFGRKALHNPSFGTAANEPAGAAEIDWRRARARDDAPTIDHAPALPERPHPVEPRPRPSRR